MGVKFYKREVVYLRNDDDPKNILDRPATIKDQDRYLSEWQEYQGGDQEVVAVTDMNRVTEADPRSPAADPRVKKKEAERELEDATRNLEDEQRKEEQRNEQNL